MSHRDEIIKEITPENIRKRSEDAEHLVKSHLPHFYAYHGWDEVAEYVRSERPELAELMSRLTPEKRSKHGYLYLRASSNEIRDLADYKLSRELYEICVKYDPTIVRVVIIA